MPKPDEYGNLTQMESARDGAEARHLVVQALGRLGRSQFTIHDRLDDLQPIQLSHADCHRGQLLSHGTPPIAREGL
ncbi:MAG TPA: hypothetical protein VGM84_19165 [Steroidobacteraceae bacterium]|jgi:hypothetical protein